MISFLTWFAIFIVAIIAGLLVVIMRGKADNEGRDG